jgi:hypothetical protein
MIVLAPQATIFPGQYPPGLRLLFRAEDMYVFLARVAPPATGQKGLAVENVIPSFEDPCAVSQGSLIQIHLIWFLVFVLLIHILNHMLQYKKVRPLTAMDLDAILVIPLDNASNLLTIGKLDNHGSLGSHLLNVIIVLCVRYFRRYALPGHLPIPGHLVLYFRQARANKFPVNHLDVLQGRLQI